MTLRLREVLLWAVSLLLMVGLHYFVRHTKMGKAMQAMAQDQEAARMVGIDVDRVVMLTFFLGSAMAGAAGLIFGLYYNYTSYLIGYTAGLRAFTAAVLGGIGNIPGAMLGGVVIGLIESLGGQYIAVRWTDVIIFSLLVLVLVFRPTGLLGRPRRAGHKGTSCQIHISNPPKSRLPRPWGARMNWGAHIAGFRRSGIAPRVKSSGPI